MYFASFLDSCQSLSLCPLPSTRELWASRTGGSPGAEDDTMLQDMTTRGKQGGRYASFS